MNRFNKLLEEWEKTLMLITAAGAVLFFLILLWPADQAGNISQSGALPASPDYVQTGQMTFLEPAQLDQSVNPMAFRRKMPSADKPGKAPRNDPGNNSAGQSKPVADPVKTPPPVPPPVKPPRIITLTYRGLYKGLQEQELAFIRASDSAAKNKTVAGTLPAGEKFHGLFTILSFDENKLTLQYQDQKTLILTRNQDTKVTIE